MGIPQGNTVALAGDPGTGKTTFLLTFFRYGCGAGPEGIRLAPNRGPNDPADASLLAREKFDDLIRPSALKEPRAAERKKYEGTLRCFISLESSFHRIRTTHLHVMEGRPGDGSASSATSPDNSDVFVFIDATSFLSGRLEDRLRYPRLKDAQGHDDLGSKWVHFDFSIGGYESQNDLPVLYWQRKAEKKGASDPPPVRIDQIDDLKMSPFASEGPQFRLLNLATMPIADPMKRIRLLKDLLSELFADAGEKRDILVAIDSLSALLTSFGVADAAASERSGRRLHVINLVRWFEENDVTSIMACEAVRESGQTLRRQPLFLGTQERYVASGVVQLDYHQYRSGDLIRYFRILKMRGANHDMRPHAYELGSDGIAWIEPLYAEPEMEV